MPVVTAVQRLWNYGKYFNMNQANRFADKTWKLSAVWEIHAKSSFACEENAYMSVPSMENPAALARSCLWSLTLKHCSSMKWRQVLQLLCRLLLCRASLRCFAASSAWRNWGTPVFALTVPSSAALAAYEWVSPLVRNPVVSIFCE